MQRVDTLIALWPSMADLGRDLGLPYSTVAAWKQRGSIPVSYWGELVRAARQRGYRQVTPDLLIEVHDQAAFSSPAGGFAEDAPKIDGDDPRPREDSPSDRQFSRWKPLRRTHFATMDEIVDHVRALRDEWDRR